jgi:hypothetical protein
VESLVDLMKTPTWSMQVWQVAALEHAGVFDCLVTKLKLYSWKELQGFGFQDWWQSPDFPVWVAERSLLNQSPLLNSAHFALVLQLAALFDEHGIVSPEESTQLSITLDFTRSQVLVLHWDNTSATQKGFPFTLAHGICALSTTHVPGVLLPQLAAWEIVEAVEYQ